jgi:hypothetical protein
MGVSAQGYVQYCRERRIRVKSPCDPTSQQFLALTLAVSGLLLHVPTVALLMQYFSRRTAETAGTLRSSSEMLNTLQRLQENAAEQDGKRSSLAVSQSFNLI